MISNAFINSDGAAIGLALAVGSAISQQVGQVLTQEPRLSKHSCLQLIRYMSVTSIIQTIINLHNGR